MKYILMVLVCASALFALDIQIKPDQNITVSNEDIDWTISSYSAKRMNIERKDAQKVAYDNKLLSNEYLKIKEIPSDIAKSIQNQLEEKLADMYIKELQEKEIPSDVIESYYMTHKQDFVKDKNVTLTIFGAQDFDSALGLYSFAKDAPTKAYDYAKDHNITETKRSFELSKLQPQIAQMLKNNKDFGYITPPFPFFGKYNLFIVEEIAPSRPLTTQEAQEAIKKILLDKKFMGKKIETLKKLKGEKDEE